MTALVCIMAIILGIACRYTTGLTQGCLFVGKAISDTGSKTGFQDAVSPPIMTPVTFAVWGACAALIGWTFWNVGLASGIVVTVVFFVASAVAGTAFVPKPDSPFWVKVIYRSLARRVADYRKAGDNMRADAAEALVRRIESRLADKLMG